MAKPGTALVISTDLAGKANTYLFYDGTSGANKGFKTTALFTELYYGKVAEKTASNVAGDETLVE